jgi:hypothetical protein
MRRRTRPVCESRRVGRWPTCVPTSPTLMGGRALFGYLAVVLVTAAVAPSNDLLAIVTLFVSRFLLVRYLDWRDTRDVCRARR